jgi:DNA-binding transcriptional LysR family regulator
VEPTPAGETLLEHARAMLAGQERIARDMAAFAAGVRGQVRVLATASAIAESLADDVAAFLKKPEHRDIRVDIEERVSNGVISGVREGMAAVGICWDVADFTGLRTRPWRSDHLAVVTPLDHPLAHRDHLYLAETLDQDHVSLPPSSAVQLMLQRAAALAGKTVNYRVVVATFDAALRVVRAGLAISVLPAELARPYAQAFGLRVVPLADAWAQRRFALSTRDENTLSPAAALLVEHLAGLGQQEHRNSD